MKEEMQSKVLHLYFFLQKTRLGIQLNLQSGKGIIQSSLHAALHITLPLPKRLWTLIMEWNSPILEHLPLTFKLEHYLKKNKGHLKLSQQKWKLLLFKGLAVYGSSNTRPTLQECLIICRYCTLEGWTTAKVGLKCLESEWRVGLINFFHAWSIIVSF